MNLRQVVTGFSLSICFASTVLAEDTTPVAIDSIPAATAKASSLGAVALGRPIQLEAVKYPKRALRNKVQGTVVLKLTVARDGKVTRVESLSGDAELAESAIRSARKWSHIPYFRETEPVEVQTTVSINFKINEAGKPDIAAAFEDRQSPPINHIAKPGAGVTAPKVIYAPDPEYSREAQHAHLEGMVVLSLIVGPDGYPRDIKVTRALGKGLDEKAIEAVQKWRFLPATKGGVPVAVAINVEVEFRL
jgi:TonB family protein